MTIVKSYKRFLPTTCAVFSVVLFILFCFLFGPVLVFTSVFFLVEEHCKEAKAHYTLFVQIAKYNAYMRCTFGKLTARSSAEPTT